MGRDYLQVKQPKKPTARKQRTDSLQDIFSATKSGASNTDTPTKLAKVLKLPAGTANIHKLHAILKKNIGLDALPDYVSFLKTEWVLLGHYLPSSNRKTRGLADYKLTAQVLVDNMSTVLSLYKTYKTNEYQYKHRLGILEQWEVEVLDKDKRITDIISLNKKAAKLIEKKSAEIDSLKKDLGAYKKAYLRARPFAMSLAVQLRLIDTEFVEYLEGFRKKADVGGVEPYMDKLFEET